MILVAYGLLRVLTGAWHMFAPDGGAMSIAGLDLSLEGPAIVALFAWAGATQLAIGLAALVVAFRSLTLWPWMLGIGALEQALIVVNAWLLKPVIQPNGAVMPPATFVGIAGTLILLVATLIAVRHTLDR
jgi:hypothetical protein